MITTSDPGLFPDANRLRTQLQQLERRVQNLSGNVQYPVGQDLRHLLKEVLKVAQMETEMNALKLNDSSIEERLSKLSQDRLSREEIRSIVKNSCGEQENQIVARVKAELAPKKSQKSASDSWPPSWISELEKQLGEENKLLGINAFCHSLQHTNNDRLHKDHVRFRVLAELLGIQIGIHFCIAVVMLPPENKRQALDGVNSWFRSIEYPFKAYCPIPGESFDPEFHDSEDPSTKVSKVARINEVLCWGLRSRGPKPRIISRAVVSVDF